MATHSTIGITTRANADQPVHGYRVVSCHSDGYPAYTGYQLAHLAEQQNWDIETIGNTLLSHDWSIISATSDRGAGSGHIKTMPGWGNFYIDLFTGPVEGDVVNGPVDFTWLYLFDAPTRTLGIYRAAGTGYRLLTTIIPKDTEGKLGERLLELEQVSASWG